MNPTFVVGINTKNRGNEANYLDLNCHTRANNINPFNSAVQLKTYFNQNKQLFINY